MQDDGMQEVRDVFLDECVENVALLETGLLDLAEQGGDALNAVFRAAHSIKGGAATFGFVAMAELAHCMEALLDSARGTRAILSSDDVDMLLRGVDVVRGLVDTGRRDPSSDDPVRKELQSRLLARAIELNDPDSAPAAGKRGAGVDSWPGTPIVDGTSQRSAERDVATTMPSGDGDATARPPQAAASTWRVALKPHLDFHRRGNDGVLLLDELRRLGSTTSRHDLDALPAWAVFDPQSAYLGWEAELDGSVAEEALRELFEWVEGDCDLDIERAKPGQETPHPAPAGERSSVQTASPPDAAAAGAKATQIAAVPAMPSGDVACVAVKKVRDPSIDESATSRAPTDASIETVPDGGDDANGAEASAAHSDMEPGSHTAPDNSSDTSSRGAHDDPSAASSAPKARAGRAHEPSIRISTGKIDQIIDLVGELVITQSMLSRLVKADGEIDKAELIERMNTLEVNTRDLQESVMRTRMLPMSAAFSRLPRLVHDLSRRLGKSAELLAEGGETELDKTVLERMVDPLVHIVRNALDHGIEAPHVREAKGKPATSVLRVSARQESGGVIIEVIDDGAGLNPERILAKARAAGLIGMDERPLDEQLFQLVFSPALSTAEKVTDVSGRGVGLDVVRQNIVALGGRVSLDSKPDVGTRIAINLPLSLAILDGQLVRIGGEVYVIPILSIVETQQRVQASISTIPGIGEVCRFRGQVVKVIDVAAVFDRKVDSAPESQMIVIVEMHGERSGLLIEEVLGQQQVVVKSLERNYTDMPGIAGATIMSDGSVALILDPTTLPGLPTTIGVPLPRAA